MDIFNFLPTEIWKEIFQLLDFLSKIRLRQINKIFYKILNIYDFYNIDKKYLDKLKDDILINYKYIEYLDSSHNSYIKNIGWMKHLKKLNVSFYNYGNDIDQNNINGLNLIELNISYNIKIKDVSW